jgi:quinol monooxygenase YgiN
MSDHTSDVPKSLNASAGENPIPGVRDQQPVWIIVRGRARPDQVQQARVALMKIADPIRANPDCLEFRVYQDRDDPHSFVLWERWVSEEALFAHGKRDYMAEYMAEKNKMFESIGGEFLQEIHRLDVSI